jgi:transposase
MRAAGVTLTTEQRAAWPAWISAANTEQRLPFRARIILVVADGLSNKEAAGRLAIDPPGNGQQVARPVCPIRSGRGCGRAAQRQTEALVKAGRYQHRRDIEFLDFMNRVVADYPGCEIHVILDNLNTHKPKEDRWLARHKNVHFHFTPTHASWLNQVEIWFSFLSRQALAASLTSRQQGRDQIDAFITADAHPFEWTKKVVLAKHPRL